jgi:hypothetical protein
MGRPFRAETGYHTRTGFIFILRCEKTLSWGTPTKAILRIAMQKLAKDLQSFKTIHPDLVAVYPILVQEAWTKKILQGSPIDAVAIRVVGFCLGWDGLSAPESERTVWILLDVTA